MTDTQRTIDRKTPFPLSHTSVPMPVGLICRAGSGYSFLAVTSGYAARSVKNVAEGSAIPFGKIWHPIEDDCTDLIRGADDLIALIWCNQDAVIAPQGLDDALIAPTESLRSVCVFYELNGERRDAVIESLSVTMNLPDVHKPERTYRYRGLLLARRTGTGAFGEPGHGGSLVMADVEGNRRLVGILVASNGERAVIAPLAPLFKRFDLTVVSDEEAAENNRNMDWAFLENDVQLKLELERVYSAYREAASSLQKSEAELNPVSERPAISTAARTTRAKDRVFNAPVQAMFLELDA